MKTIFDVKEAELKCVATIDFHLTAACSQACPYCWGPRRFRKPVDTEAAVRIITRIQRLGVRRIVFTGGDPLFRSDVVDLVRRAKGLGLETALSTTGDRLTPALLSELAPALDLISLPLDGSCEAISSQTKHPGHFTKVVQALEWLRRHPAVDVKVCTPVTRRNLDDIPAIARLVEIYARTTRARVFYNVFQAFPRAMFRVDWEALVVGDDEFSRLRREVGTGGAIRINFLDHATLDRLYLMVFPDGSLTIPNGAEYLNFGPFLEVDDFEQAIRTGRFDTAKHLHHSQGWGKASGG